MFYYSVDQVFEALSWAPGLWIFVLLISSLQPLPVELLALNMGDQVNAYCGSSPEQELKQWYQNITI